MVVKDVSRIVTRSPRVNQGLRNSSVWQQWNNLAHEAKAYVKDVSPHFAIRDENFEESFNLRHGLIPAYIPPSHKEIVPNVTSKHANEILVRLVALLTAVYPDWLFHPDGFKRSAGLKAADMSTLARSTWLGIEDRMGGVPIHRQAMDQQLGYGGTMYKVNWRIDRWADLPIQEGDETDPEYARRVKVFKALNIPFDVTIPEYNSLYYDLTRDGLVRVAEVKRASVYDIASQLGGTYNEKRKELRIPVTFFEDEETEEGIVLRERHSAITIHATREVEWLEYWVQGKQVTFVVNGTPVRVDTLSPKRKLPYFLALGEVTSSPDPGRMGLPVLYNVVEEFKRLLNLRAMEDAFLSKHGYARLKHKLPRSTAGAAEPEMGDQEEEEEVIGEILEERDQQENWEYMVPANVSVLFHDAKADIKEEINEAALADFLSGRMPPSGTTGFLMSQLATAAVSKYVPLLTQQARAIRDATLYMFDLLDTELESEFVVRTQIDEPTAGPLLSYKPGQSKGLRNLEVRIEAPLPTDQIAKTQWLTAGWKDQMISKETVQREGYRVKQTEMENEKIRLETFDRLYEPIAMMRAIQRAGRSGELAQAAALGILPPELQQLALMFASGPDGQSPPPDGVNPNGVVAAGPGAGEPVSPSLGATSNAVVAGGGRAAGAERRPGGPRDTGQPLNPDVVVP